MYIKAERGSRRCEIHSKQIPSEEQRPYGLPPTAFFIFTSFHTDCLGSLTDKGGFERKQPSEYLFSVSPLFPLSVFFFSSSLLPREAPDFYQRIIMLNNMDLNAKDSFYPQFDNCNASSLGMENGARKDNQEVYVEAAERGAPAQFGHGESTVLQERSVECACTAGFGCFFVLFFPSALFLSKCVKLPRHDQQINCEVVWAAFRCFIPRHSCAPVCLCNADACIFRFHFHWWPI